MQIRVESAIATGDLLCLKTTNDGSKRLDRWQLGDEAIGVAARSLAKGAMVDYTPGQSSADVLVKGSHLPRQGQIITLKAAADLVEEDLICLRRLPSGVTVIDKWKYGEEAIGIAARTLPKGSDVRFCPDASTEDIHVRPSRSAPSPR